jgi:hypothetical protein
MFLNLGKLAQVSLDINIPRDSDQRTCDDQLRWVSSNFNKSLSLREVSVTICSDDEANFPSLELLVAQCRVRLSLSLIYDTETDINLLSLCAGITAARSLTAMNLGIWLSPNGFEEILVALQGNEALQDLELYVTFVAELPNEEHQTEQIGNSLQEFISNNKSLGAFCFAYDFFNGSPGERINAHHVVRGLASNRHLRVLNLRYTTSTTDSDSAELMQVLSEHNTTLEEIKGLRIESEAQREQINQLLALNRYGRNFIASPHQVPLDLWGDILSRVSTDECNRFLVDLARRAVLGRPAESPRWDRRSARKRPRSPASRAASIER